MQDQALQETTMTATICVPVDEDATPQYWKLLPPGWDAAAIIWLYVLSYGGTSENAKGIASKLNIPHQTCWRIINKCVREGRMLRQSRNGVEYLVCVHTLAQAEEVTPQKDALWEWLLDLFSHKEWADCFKTVKRSTFLEAVPAHKRVEVVAGALIRTAAVAEKLQEYLSAKKQYDAEEYVIPCVANMLTMPYYGRGYTRPYAEVLAEQFSVYVPSAADIKQATTSVLQNGDTCPGGACNTRQEKPNGSVTQFILYCARCTTRVRALSKKEGQKYLSESRAEWKSGKLFPADKEHACGAHTISRVSEVNT